jgi:hypothetical protein
MGHVTLVRFRETTPSIGIAMAVRLDLSHLVDGLPLLELLSGSDDLCRVSVFHRNVLWSSVLRPVLFLLLSPKVIHLLHN